ncbi:hypothetical protein [Yoonia vestfoldensis]|uniref:hypothetical protein n=1 Tax=Yoonia vestfoldensis TaxID=245188 RepID=UPI00036D5DCF|nr:hypothetical protein [Yoonia vestfoldensis]
MKNIAYAVAAMAALGACDGVGGGDGGAGGPGTPPVTGDASLRGDLDAFAFNGTDTLSVQISLESDDVLQAYTQDGAPINGYIRFVQQDDPLDRFATAFAKRSDDGSVDGTVVLVGGQFNRFFGGAGATQNNYSAPAGGLASYTGEYIGLLNRGPAAPGVPGGTPDVLIPRTATPVTGEVFVNADFADNLINGAIFNREFGADGTGTELADIVLVVGGILPDGTFSGDVELRDLTGIGSYSGTFGGQNASAVAGMVELQPGFLRDRDNDLLPSATATDSEYGIFVLSQCPTSQPRCATVDGIND